MYSKARGQNSHFIRANLKLKVIKYLPLNGISVYNWSSEFIFEDLNAKTK